jgi:DNA-binding CsgD family transcriptional regulator
LFAKWGSDKTARSVADQFNLTFSSLPDDEKNTENSEYTYKKIETLEKGNVSLGDRLRPSQKKLEALELEAAYPYFLEVIGVHTAADSEAIFLERDDKIFLKYQWTEAEGSKKYESDEHTEKVQDLPRTVIRYVSRTYEEVILPEKPWEGHFSGDSYFKKRKDISFLCLPLKYKGIFVGLIYLESWSNNGFSSQDIDFIKGLSFYLVAKVVLERENMQSGKANISPLIENLTSRELEVLSYMAKGLSNKEIARKLGINSSTVKTHTLRIYRKFSVSSRLQAVTKATQLKLL